MNLSISLGGKVLFGEDNYLRSIDADLGVYRGQNWFKIKGENKFDGELNNYSREK